MPPTAETSPGLSNPRDNQEESVVFYMDSSKDRKKPGKVVFPTDPPIKTTTENEVSVVYYVDPTTDATDGSKEDREDEVSVVYYT